VSREAGFLFEAGDEFVDGLFSARYTGKNFFPFYGDLRNSLARVSRSGFSLSLSPYFRLFLSRRTLDVCVRRRVRSRSAASSRESADYRFETEVITPRMFVFRHETRTGLDPDINAREIHLRICSLDHWRKIRILSLAPSLSLSRARA